MMTPSIAQTVLVIAAHPDDEVLGVGATMARLASEGHRVCVLIVGEGVGLRHPGSTLDSIRTAARTANRLLGVAEVYFGGLNLSGKLLDEIPNRTLVALVAGHLEELRPQIVFTHHPSDVHVDHQAIGRATQYCFRAGACPSLSRMLTYEVLSSTEPAAPGMGRAFEPSVYYDVEAYLSLKVEAMKCYGAEIHPYPHPRSPKAIEVQARYRGLAAGVQNAEAFVLIREIL